MAKNRTSQLNFCNVVMQLVDDVSKEEIKKDEEAERRGEDRQKILDVIGPYSNRAQRVQEERGKLEKEVEEEKAKKGGGNKSAA